MTPSWPFGPPVVAAPEPAAEVRRPCGCLCDPLVFGHLCRGPVRAPVLPCGCGHPGCHIGRPYDL